MKAKDYVKMFDETDLKSKEDLAILVNEIFKMFLQEFVDMQKVRGKTQPVITGILNELDNKWRSVASKVSILKPDGFRKMLFSMDKNTATLAGWNMFR